MKHVFGTLFLLASVCGLVSGTLRAQSSRALPSGAPIVLESYQTAHAGPESAALDAWLPPGVGSVHVASNAVERVPDSKKVLSNGWVLSERLLQYWVVLDSFWENSAKEISLYDTSGRQREYETQRWLDDAWVRDYRYRYEYDPEGRLVDFFSHVWGGGSWVNYAHWGYSFDTHGNQTSFLVQKWNGAAWVNESLDSSRYDEGGCLTYFVHRTWGGLDWVNVSKNIYGNDSAGHRTRAISMKWNGFSWVNERQDTTWYDASGHPYYRYYESWDFENWAWGYWGEDFIAYDTGGREIGLLLRGLLGGSPFDFGRFSRAYDAQGNCVNWKIESGTPVGWQNYMQYFYGFNAGGLRTSETIQRGMLEEWINSTRDFFTYDAGGHRTSHLNQKWSGAMWSTRTNDVYAYDEHGNLASEAHLLWDGNAWGNYYRYISTWQSLTEAARADLLPGEYRLAENFPNPFNPSTTIRYALKAAGAVTLRVYDLLGREVALLVDEKKEPGAHAAVWNAGDLPTGVYFYRLNAPGFVQTKKMMLLR